MSNPTFSRNRTKVFLFLAPHRGLKFNQWDTRWALLAVPFLFTVQFYWEPNAAKKEVSVVSK